ncbi:uncharacterized protein LOC135485028 [Lineus longissimus]|uniref:uncharacterized protein LOC135485028 n=1 Tax=Lineus longissimus TaxID=88925 RepID=UPI00315CF028
MEVTAWQRNDELVSMLTSLSDHIQHGRSNDAIAVVKTIRKDGGKFHESVETMTKCVNQLFEQKKREMESMQEKRDDIAKKIPSLESGIGKCEKNITQHENEEEASRRRESQADDTYQRADRDWDEGEKKAEFQWWYVFVPVVGQVAGICNIVSGENQMSRARKDMLDARSDKERAQRSLLEARNKKLTEQSKLDTLTDLAKECEILYSELHTEVTFLKDASSFTFKLNGVLQEVLLVTDAALVRTDRLKKMLENFMVKTGVLESRGTRTLLRTVRERWMEVRDLVVNVPNDRNALIWQEAQRKTALSLGRKELKEFNHLLSSLKTKLSRGQASDAIETLKGMQVKGAHFEMLAQAQKEHSEQREKWIKEEIKRTEKILSIEDQLDSIGYGSNVTELRREYRHQKKALEELIEQRKYWGRCVESVETNRYMMGELRSTLKVCAYVPNVIVRAFKSHSLLQDVSAIEAGWEALSYG